MSIQNLDRIFKPQTIAVIGASSTLGKVGHTVLRNLLTAGFAGRIYPINPKCATLEGLVAFPSVKDVPESIDLAIICTPSESVPQLIAECGEAGIRGVVILTAGFRETGPAGAELESSVLATATKFSGMRILGPNCLGVISPAAKLNASFARSMPKHGSVAFISQSGALCTAILDWSIQENIGFSHFVSVGNMLDVGFADLIDYFSTDPMTNSIVMYIESLTAPRDFMSAARAFSRRKPIIVYKAGRYAQSAHAAASHTGAMAGVDAVYEAAFARAGIVRVFELEQMFDCAELLSRQHATSGPRLAIVTNAGGPGVMATDSLIEHQGELATLSEETIERLNEQLPSAWSRGNPIDLLGDATPERLESGLNIVLKDPGVDAVLVILSPQAMTDPLACANAVILASKRTSKPLIASWMGGASMRTSIDALNAAEVPNYTTPEKAIRAFMELVRYQRLRERLYETPRAMPLEFSLDREKLHSLLETNIRQGHALLSELQSKALLEAYEIPVVPTCVAHTASEAIDTANRLGYPVALKIFSVDITHKTEVGGVALNLATDDDVNAAFEQIIARAHELRPDARIQGVTVQKMISVAGGCELIVGAKRDPVFGPVLMVGSGGITAELMQDRALELPPLTERLARHMLMSLRLWPVLQGYRGRPPVDIERLIEVLMRVSYLIADCPEIEELDINPLLATPEGVVALDARVVVTPRSDVPSNQPYSHLAIRPYPEQFMHELELTDRTKVLLRPIRPEDEPLWHAMLAGCSQATLHKRFHHLFKSTTHEMATRACFIDYDREITMVAQVEQQGRQELIAIASLVADLNHQDAEYAVLVTDAWQGKGLGSTLTDHCLNICRLWGIQKVRAQVETDNARMLSLFASRGFQLDRGEGDHTVLASKKMDSAN